jgi:2-aminoadipate transaminase
VESPSDLFSARTREGVGDALSEILAFAGATDLISFSGGFPDPATFPGETLADLLRELIRAGDPSPFQYSPTRGLPGPLDYVSERIERMDGRRPDQAELLITSGSIEALELVGKTFLDPFDLVVVEGPTYLGAIMAFRSFQARVLAVPMDADGGLRIDVLANLLETGARPKLVYTIPDHQNPAGVSMSAERRTALVGLARSRGFLIVEDVAYRELGFTDEIVPSLWSMAPDVVVQAGTFSKTFFPGVRLGWAAGPEVVIEKLVTAKQNTDQCAAPLGQRLLEGYGRAGHLDKQIVGARELYRRRADLLLGAMGKYLPEEVSWTSPAGGFFTWLTLPDGMDSVDLAREALADRVAFVPGRPFFPDGRGRTNIRLAFSRVEDEDIDEGVRRLGALLQRHWIEEGG